MSDLNQRIFDIICHPQLATLATITEENHPWVRYVVTVGGPDLTMRCATMLDARKVAQIKKNPNVHLTCGVSTLQEMSPYLQIVGIAQITTEKEERHNFWNDMLGSIFTGPEDPNYAIIIIKPQRIEFCSQGSEEPEIWES